MFWLLIALLELLLHAASSVQLHRGAVSFQCSSVGGQTLEIRADVNYRGLEVAGQIITLLLGAHRRNLSFFLSKAWMVTYILSYPLSHCSHLGSIQNTPIAGTS